MVMGDSVLGQNQAYMDNHKHTKRRRPTLQLASISEDDVLGVQRSCVNEFLRQERVVMVVLTLPSQITIC
jgi:hypothetical protein